MFYKARIKLTLWYVLMIMIVSFLFSAAIYQIQMSELRRIESSQRSRINRQLEMRNMAPLVFELNFIDEVRKHLMLNLLYLNGIILALSGFFAWILSGKTLNPIHVMMLEQRRFISDASHEFKTPLTALKTTFEVFNRSKKRTLGEAQAIINESINEVNRLQKLTESLLQLAQLQESSTNQLFEISSIKSLLKNAIKKTKLLAQQKHIAVRLNGVDVQANVIADDMINLFVILIENAIKYSPKKNPIDITVQKNRSEAIIKISDSGAGISKKDLPYIFDRFYRADDARTHSNTSGYGLGLSIAKQIVKKHRGTIQVESQTRKGTAFTIRIPLKHIYS